MLNLKKVAVTGGLSSGKSSVCRIFKNLGAYVVSADEIVHQLLSTDDQLCEAVVDLLGPSVLVGQKLNRSRIAELVFRDRKALKSLEELIHPEVNKKIEEDYQRQKQHPHSPPLFIAEIPLLFETGGERHYDFTIAVVADQKTCCARFAKKMHLSEDEFKMRMAMQMDPALKARLADAVLVNTGSLDDLSKDVEMLFFELCQ